MQQYIASRVLQAAVALVGITILIFIFSRIIGDPVLLLLPDEAKQEDYVALQKRLGLDKPLPVQYFVFIKNAAQGDLGDSFRYRTSALKLVIERLPATFELALMAMGLAVFAGVLVGVLSAVYRNSPLDSLGKAIALAGQAAPTFWVGIMLILVFAVTFRLFPTGGRGGFKHLILPAITLGWYSTAAVMRLTRSSMLDVLENEYIRMIRIKGLPERMVIYKHALKNGALPVITMVGLQLATLLSGAVVTETVFAWPGVGRLAVEAIFVRDYPVIQAVVIVVAVIYLASNTLVDLLYAYLDPRIRY